MFATRRLALCLTLGLCSAGQAEAHAYEFGVTIEPAFVSLPAVADENSKNTLTLAAGGGVGLEYHLIDQLAVVVRGGYAQSFGTSQIGQATFSKREGNYYFEQSAGYALAGLRLETPSHWLPVTLFVSVLGGASFLPQVRRKLLDDTGTDYGLALADQLKILPTISTSLGISGRVSNQIRIQLEPAFYIFPVRPVLLGYGITLGITFLFFT